MSLLTLASCKKDDLSWQHDYFSFLTKTMEVSINEETEFFTLKGSMSRTLNHDRESEIQVYEERTTAVKGTHYELSDNLMYFTANSKESEIKVRIIRGSIKMPLDLTLFHVYYDPEKDTSNHIDTITVKLIPTLK